MQLSVRASPGIPTQQSLPARAQEAEGNQRLRLDRLRGPAEGPPSVMGTGSGLQLGNSQVSAQGALPLWRCGDSLAVCWYFILFFLLVTFRIRDAVLDAWRLWTGPGLPYLCD